MYLHNFINTVVNKKRAKHARRWILLSKSKNESSVLFAYRNTLGDKMRLSGKGDCENRGPVSQQPLPPGSKVVNDPRK